MSKSQPTKGGVKMGKQKIGSQLQEQNRHGKNEQIRPRPQPEPVIAIIPRPRPNQNGKCEPRCKPSSSIVSTPTHERLLDWCKDLGYIPGGHFRVTKDYPALEDLKKLCRPELSTVWEHLMRHIKPMNKIEAFRKYKARKGTDADSSKLALLKSQHSHLVKKATDNNSQIKKEEAECKEIEENINMKYVKYKALKRNKQDYILKMEPLKMKSRKLRDETHYSEAVIEELNLVRFYKRDETVDDATSSPSTLLREPESLGFLQDAMNSLRKIHDKHDRLLSTANEGERVTVHDDLEELLASINHRSAEFSVRDISRGLITLQGDNLRKVEELEELEGQSPTVPSTSHNTYLSMLAGPILRARLETERNKAECEIREEILAGKKREYLERAVEQLTSSAARDRTAVPDAEVVEHWLESEVAAEQARLRVGKYKELNDAMRKEMPDLKKLNEEFLESKTRITDGKDALKHAQLRINKNIRLVLSTRSKVDESFDACDAALKDLRASLTHVDALREMFSATRGDTVLWRDALVAMPFDAVDYVAMPTGCRVLRKDMLINYDCSFPRLPRFESRLLEGAPQSCVSDVVTRLYRKKQYDRQLAWEIETPTQFQKIPTFDDAAHRSEEVSMLAAMRGRVTAAEQSYGRLRQLTDVTVPGMLIFLRNPPFARLVPPGATVKGKTFAQWRQEYEDALERAQRAVKPR